VKVSGGVPMTEGQRLVRALVAARGVALVARKTKTSDAGVKHWATGRRKPGAEARLLLEKHFGVGVSAWDEKPPPPATKPKIREPGEPLPPSEPIAEEVTSKELAFRHIQRILRQIEEAEADEASTRELAQLDNALSTAIRVRARTAGELEVTEAMLMRSTAWARAMRVLFEALEKHPEAAKDVEAAFSAMVSA
jgi:hypothetical protein